MRKIRLLHVGLSVVLLSFFALGALAQTNRTISGIVVDKRGNPLPFATVGVASSGTGVYTDNEGRFTISVPDGARELVVSYLGYNETSMPIEASSQTGNIKIEMRESSMELDEVQVYGKLTRGQAKALNVQKLSPNIKNVVDAEQFLRYPDVSAAETVQRLPGISITRDQGEGEFVQIRGVPEQFNSLTMNGQRMPSMEPDAGRAVGLDLVQTYLIQTISVTKALTADMDADAIGGMVDFQLREASKETELEVYAGYGLNQQESEYNNFGEGITSFSAIGAKRVADNKLGLLVAGSYFNTDRGAIFNSQRFISLEENTLNRRRTTDYDVNRERYGLVGNFDFKLNNLNKWTLTTNYNRYIDDEIRQQARYTWDNTREERRTRNRIEDQQLSFYMLQGEHQFGKAKLDYSGSYSIGDEDLPDRTEWRYRRSVDALGTLSRNEQASLSANSTFGVSDPLEFNSVDFDPRFTEETNSTVSFNLEFPTSNSEKSTLKLGVKYRALEREFLEGGFEPELNDGEALQSFAEGTFAFPGLRFTDAAFASLGFDLVPSDINFSTDLDGYTATEDVFAAYLMNTAKLTDKLTSVIGVRFEGTSTNYFSLVDELRGEGEYSNVLPYVHFTYRFDSNNQLRVAYSSGISRPNYSALVPFESIGDDEINRGNEDLEAITASNFDIMFERYTNGLGFIGFGVFAKTIDNQIITDQVGTEDGLPIFTSVNGASASVFGFEASINKSLASLNLPFTVNANYTFTESEADFGDDRDNLPLANSPKHVGNLSLLFDDPNSKFSGVIGGVYRHFMFNKFEDTDDAVDGNEEIWLDKTFHLDFSILYSVTEKFSLKFQMNNLTNQANSEITGKPSETFSQWSETESYGAWGLFGIEFKL